MATTLKQWLEETVAEVKPPWGLPVHEFVLHHGVVHKPQRLPKKYKRGEQHQCFMNASHLVLDNPKLTYVEGFAGHVIPVHHAWCIDKRGKVIDPTWDYPELCEYVGVEIPTVLLARELVKLETYAVLDTQNGPNMNLMKELAGQR